MSVDAKFGPGDPTASFKSSATAIGDTVAGRYKLREQIGEGGMGTVWVAEQFEPVRRRVALKLIKPGMDSRQVLSRFEVERQALALMDHLNIAKVLDGGVTDLGRPFFVMEYVKGVPITQYCDDAKVSVAERLKLFMQVCQAVQHAHQKGIIHRDLKPSNILVCLYDGQPVPKVIDFGLAKAMHQPLTEHTLYTAHGLMVGTPLYMSPEQAEFNNLDVDTRTDIYSLGVILYELLTGTTPLERKQLKDAAWQEVLRVIKEEEPQKPSTKISGSGSLPTVAAQRGLEPAQLCRIVRGDLDWIVMKSLEKERSRRYETANGLAKDIARYLNDEPVEACPPSLAYQLRKLARRNRQLLTTAALLGIVVIAALTTVAGSVGWVVRDRQTRQAVVERGVLATLEEASVSVEQDRLLDAQAAVKQAQGLLVNSAPGAEIVARVRQWQSHLNMANQLDDIYLQKPTVGNTGAARIIAAYERAFREYGLDLVRSGPTVAQQIGKSPIKRQLIAAIDDWALLVQDERTPGRPSAGKGLRRSDLFAIASAADGDLWRDRLREALRRNDLQALRRLLAEDQWRDQLPITMGLVAQQLKLSDEVKAAVAVLREAHRRNPGDFWINYHLGVCLSVTNPSEAVGFLRTVVAQRQSSAAARLLLGWALWSNEQIGEAEAEYREALRLNPDSAIGHACLGIALLDTSPREAEAELRLAMRLDPHYYSPGGYLQRRLAEQGKFAEAEAMFRAAIEAHPEAAPGHHYLGAIYILQQKWSDAEKQFRETVRLDPNSFGAWRELGTALQYQDHLAEAEAVYRRSIELAPKHYLAHRSLGHLLARRHVKAPSRCK